MFAGRKPDAPPATPEAQAKLIIEAIKGRQDGWFCGEHIIASALRQAEDAALERAAVHIETEIGSVSPSWVPDLVRALKSTKD